MSEQQIPENETEEQRQQREQQEQQQQEQGQEQGQGQGQGGEEGGSSEEIPDDEDGTASGGPESVEGATPRQRGPRG
jgi:transcription initiation factor TFIID subunit TAF12